jgi:NADH:ubiquinone oxidoreductase subunit F (NADH-binding)
MNEQQMRARAETEVTDRLPNRSAKVRIAARGRHAIADTCCGIFGEWAAKDESRPRIIRTGSLGYEDLEPIAIIEKPGNPTVFYTQVHEDSAALLIRDYLTGGNPRPDLAWAADAAESFLGIPAVAGLPLFRLQKRIALRNCGLVDPKSISDYIQSCQGYSGLAKAVRLHRTDVIGEMEKAGLRERTGQGRPVAAQWNIMQETKSQEKIVIGSAFEGDVQFRCARLLGEGDPHAVLEGLLLAAYAIGASRCMAVLPAGFPELKDRMERAVSQMREYGLVGRNILDSGFDCEIQIRTAPASIIASEETALLRCLEGRQTIPFLRRGENELLHYDGKPVLIHGMETLANVSAVFQNKAGALSECGTEESKGTKVISLGGAVAHPYTIEVPFGTTLETVIRQIGGGSAPDASAANRSGKTMPDIKAVQFGGPASVYLGTEELNLPIAYEYLAKTGSTLGFGLIEVVPDDACMVETAARQLELLHGQSCGKCVFCREGTLHLSRMLEEIAKGEGAGDYFGPDRGFGRENACRLCLQFRQERG